METYKHNYSQQEAKTIFGMRVQSQEYKGLKSKICFTPRILSSIISRYYKECKTRHIKCEVDKKLVANWKKNMIMNIQVHTSKGDFLFRNVSNIKITESNEVLVDVNSNYDVNLMTRTGSGTLVNMTAEDISKIQIVHNNSISDVLNEFAKDLLCLQRITNDMQEYCRSNDIDIQKRVYYDNIVENYDFDELQYLALGIEKELKLLENPFSYELKQGK